MRTSNPTLTEDVFISLDKENPVASQSNTMTIEGTVNKTGFFLMLTMTTALFAWFAIQVTGEPNKIGGIVNPGLTTTFLLVGGIGSFIVAMFVTFKKNFCYDRWHDLLPARRFVHRRDICLCRKLTIGIAMQAGLLTFGTLFGLLAMYKSK